MVGKNDCVFVAAIGGIRANRYSSNKWLSASCILHDFIRSNRILLDKIFSTPSVFCVSLSSVLVFDIAGRTIVV